MVYTLFSSFSIVVIHCFGVVSFVLYSFLCLLLFFSVVSGSLFLNLGGRDLT